MVTRLLKYRPWFFWQIISDISQLWTRNHLKHAFQILCVKEIDGSNEKGSSIQKEVVGSKDSKSRESFEEK